MVDSWHKVLAFRKDAYGGLVISIKERTTCPRVDFVEHGLRYSS